LLKVHCPQLAALTNPGQFFNIKVSESIFPLLRRPFSICDVEGESLYFMFNILGEGTKLLAHKKVGDTINILGPLGVGFNFIGNYKTAVLAAGGLGAAPFPYLIREIEQSKEIKCFVGGRSSHDVIQYGMKNITISTDDGSIGLKGTVVQLLEENLKEIKKTETKIFGCGPTAMLRALKDFAIKNNIECEVSTECSMACGFGICMGCPIEDVNHPDKYKLVCKDGPVFNVKDVVI
jgi:dihydroorotate dehydrogenase electron transfer subunit